MTWENVEITKDVRALVERERRLAQAEEHLLNAVHGMRLARQALGDAIVPLVVIHEIESMVQRLPDRSVLAEAQPVIPARNEATR